MTLAVRGTPRSTSTKKEPLEDEEENKKEEAKESKGAKDTEAVGEKFISVQSGKAYREENLF